MKKLSLVAIAILTVVFMSGAAFSCGGSQNVRSVRAYSMLYEDDYLEIKIKARKAAGPTQYFTSETIITGIERILDETEPEVGTITTKLYQDRFLLIERTIPTDKFDYYLIADRTKDDGETRSYFFAPPATEFLDDDGTLFKFFVPYHLFVYDPDLPQFFEADFDKRYEMAGTKQDVSDFYNKVNIYDVTDETDRISIAISDAGENAEISEIAADGFAIYFEEENGKTFANFKAE